MSEFIIGVDVGSTTVKAVVVRSTDREIVWSDYQRHNTRQAECVLEFLERIQGESGARAGAARVYITGSGGGPIAEKIGARFVQEVNAVTLSVEALHPDAGSVIELGGQDAKIIIFKENTSGEKKAITSMNDKCASGTGATIDKCMIKVGMDPAEVQSLSFDPTRLHHVAAKCGVFAETDIVNLVKSGIPAPEIMCSLADAIVAQNLSVLTRGNTLRHKVVLLGGPNTYLPFLQQAWRLRIPETWVSREYEVPDLPIEELIVVPDNSLYYAAYGAVMQAVLESDNIGVFEGLDALREFIDHGRKAQLGASAGPPLIQTTAELEAFYSSYRTQDFVPATFEPGEVVRAVIGLDGGSTSSKCVLVGEDGRILSKHYVLSKGNPIQDTKELMADMRDFVCDQGATLEVIGFGATGYAADVLEESLKSDVNIVETVAHMMSAVHFFEDVDVVCDIGGQDIKVLFMKNNDIRSFKLSNQCSAGNGMMLQAMADQFGIPVTEYAANAFGAELSPKFSYGCAVFLDSDRVNFQKEGYSKEELLSGLAQVLPKNVWQYVVQIPRMSALGTRFVLQGGTQRNEAALKAQVDYIKERVPDAEVLLHPHCGEAGAIGAAMETLRVVARKQSTTFIGIESAINLEYSTTNDESTRCHFCENECSRSFIDTVTPEGNTSRYISGFSCEKGTVESMEALKILQKKRAGLKRHYPNLVEYEAKLAFRQFYTPEPLPADGALIDDIETTRGLFHRTARRKVKRGFVRAPEAAADLRSRVRIGIPRVLNLWSTAPFFRTYLETLGVGMRNIVFSDETSEEMFMAGGRYGSVDPCFPAKVCQAHIHDLLMNKHTGRPLDYIFFPTITHVPSPLVGVMDNTACPIVAGSPDVIRAAFTKEVDFFASRGIEYLAPAINFDERNLLKRQMFEAFEGVLALTEDESDFAVAQAWAALEDFDRRMEERGRKLIESLEENDEVGLLLLGRPYHNDPGINHSIMDEFQVLGFPVLSMRSIPKDVGWLARYFGPELESGAIDHALSIQEVWPENYSSNSAMKVWAARFAARHPNLAVIDLSSFKCGHDPPTYGLIDDIINASATPYSALHDVDANKPTGSIKIRVKTFAHRLGLLQEQLEDRAVARRELARRVEEKRLSLIDEKISQIRAAGGRVPARLLEMRRQCASKLSEDNSTSHATAGDASGAEPTFDIRDYAQPIQPAE